MSDSPETATTPATSTVDTRPKATNAKEHGAEAGGAVPRWVPPATDDATDDEEDEAGQQPAAE